jgi:hypothetical protein
VIYPDGHFPTIKFSMCEQQTTARPVPMVTAPIVLGSEDALKGLGFTSVSKCIWVKDSIGVGYWFRTRMQSSVI